MQMSETRWTGWRKPVSVFDDSSEIFLVSGNRRSRNRSRGQLLVKNSKATTLQFESDFDFETANAQFKDELTKEVVGMLPFKGDPWREQSLQAIYCVHLVILWLVSVEKVESGEAQDGPGLQEDSIGEKYYDKAKCFFDNISSDLTPRWLCNRLPASLEVTIWKRTRAKNSLFWRASMTLCF